jgi:hypothetical protein
MKPAKNPFQILFGGQGATVRFLNGKEERVFVRSLPERPLLTHFLAVMEFGAPTIELCTYTKAGTGAAPSGLFPDVRSPDGYWPVPEGWADNLSDESHAELYELAKQLNFGRAERLAQGRLSAKKQMAPLSTQLSAEIQPLVLNVLESLLAKSSTSTPKSPSSPATPASSV